MTLLMNVPLQSPEVPDREIFEYLLLGDLRQLLEETPRAETERWLLAVLDLLLVAHPRIVHSATAGTSDRTATWPPSEMNWPLNPLFFAKLQRLRDRLAHRAPYSLLSDEIRCDLAELFESATPSMA